MLKNNFASLNKIHFGRSSYKFNKKLYIDFPKLKGRSSAGEERSIGSNIFDKMPEIFLDMQHLESTELAKIYGRQDNRRTIKWIKREYLAKHANIEKWKVFLAKSNGTGELGETLSEPIIGEKGSIATQTFISFGAFEYKKEAEHLVRYLKTKFCRALLSIKKITQDNATKEIWEYVPLQDLTEKSDINWSKSIAEIDQQLYKKYGLNKVEIDFIESKVKPMT